MMASILIDQAYLSNLNILHFFIAQIIINLEKNDDELTKINLDMLNCSFNRYFAERRHFPNVDPMS